LLWAPGLLGQHVALLQTVQEFNVAFPPPSNQISTDDDRWERFVTWMREQKPPPYWRADERESGLFRHESNPKIAVAETNADGVIAWRFWRVWDGAVSTGYLPTRAEAMSAALGFNHAFVMAGRTTFYWSRLEHSGGPFDAAELAAADSLRFDTEQRRAVLAL